MRNDIIRKTINQIDSELKGQFENVDITRLENTKELTFSINLSGFKKNPNSKAIISMSMVESSIFEGSVIWKYKTNPLDSDSMEITRTSTVGTIGTDVCEIVEGDRFAKDYLDSLYKLSESVASDIDEESPEIEVEKDPTFEFELDDEVIVESITGSILDRERLSVGNVDYNVYQVYLNGEMKSVFEYDIIKK